MASLRIHIALVLGLAACGSDVAPDDTADVDAAPGPFDVPSQCTSGVRWKLGDQRSPLMHPGVACIACHAMRFDSPRFSAAGTVYATGHEPDNCNGATAATVMITDAGGATFSLQTNAAGNFYVASTLAFPIQARVVANGTSRAMTGVVMTGDCNSCHTQDGTQSAPGRIVLP